MNIIKCANGHFYDSDIFETCPHCENELFSEDMPTANIQPNTDPLAKTVALYNDNYNDATLPMENLDEFNATPMAAEFVNNQVAEVAPVQPAPISHAPEPAPTPAPAYNERSGAVPAYGSYGTEPSPTPAYNPGSGTPPAFGSEAGTAPHSERSSKLTISSSLNSKAGETAPGESEYTPLADEIRSVSGERNRNSAKSVISGGNPFRTAHFDESLNPDSEEEAVKTPENNSIDDLMLDLSDLEDLPEYDDEAIMVEEEAEETAKEPCFEEAEEPGLEEVEEEAEELEEEAEDLEEEAEELEEEAEEPVFGQSEEDASFPDMEDFPGCIDTETTKVLTHDHMIFEHVPEPVNTAKFPVVGWLVCVQGYNKGSFVSVYSGINTIYPLTDGIEIIHNENTDNQVPMDQVTLVYDPAKGDYTIQVGVSGVMIYVNDEPVLWPTSLDNRDHISYGESDYIFISFCDESFSW